MKIKIPRVIDILEMILMGLIIFPSFVSIYPRIYRIALLFQCIVAMALILLTIVHHEIDKFFIYVSSFYLMQVLSTGLFNRSYFITGLREVLCSLAVILFIRRMLANKNLRLLINLSRLFQLYIITNFLQILFLPGIFPGLQGRFSVQEVFFLGIKNQLAQQMIPMTSIAVIISYSINEKKKFSCYMITIITFACEYIVGSSTGIATSFVLMVLYILSDFIPSALVSIRTSIVGYCISSFILVASDLISMIPLVSVFVNNVFHKDITFSNRTEIWLRTVIRFWESPLIGVGRQNGKSVIRFAAINIYDRDTTYSAHNVLLQSLVESGIIGIIPVILLILEVGRKVKNVDYKRIKMVLIGIFSILVSFLMEAYDLTYLFVLLAFLYYHEGVLTRGGNNE